MQIDKERIIAQADVYVCDGKLKKYRWYNSEGINNILFKKAEKEEEVTLEEMYFITNMNRVILEDNTGMSLINFDEIEVYKRGLD